MWLNLISECIELFINCVILGCFMLLPIWFISCIIGYILQIRKCPKTTLVMPVSILLILFALINFYYCAKFYEDGNFLKNLIYSSLCLIIIYLFKNRYSHHLYFVLSLFILFSFVKYIYF